MIKKLTEVYVKDSFSNSGVLKVAKTRDVYVNPEMVTCIRKDDTLTRQVSEGSIEFEGAGSVVFTRLFMSRGQSGMDLIVAASPEEVNEVLFGKGLLNG